jgi:hypothetical protein
MRDYVIHDVKSLLYKGIFLWKKKEKKKAPKSPDFEEKRKFHEFTQLDQ